MPTESIRGIVREACMKDSNAFGFGAWSHHIEKVAEYSRLLARKLGADEEVCEISALLHDYASVLDFSFYEEHHIHGARLAEELLGNLNYPEEKIEMIKHCIMTHRGSMESERKTLEAGILASADAMAHISGVKSLLFLAYAKKGMDIDEGSEWALRKIERSWGKLMPEAKEIVREDYESAKRLLR